MPEMRISLCGRRIILASQLMAHDALAAHATYELGISENFRARSIQAASASAASFAVGATLPLLVTALVPPGALIPFVSGISLVFLALLGGLAARAGGGAGVGCGRDGVDRGCGDAVRNSLVSGANQRSEP
jgi:hypothetical protein